MHRRGILIGGSRWQQNHWQSTQTAPPFSGRCVFSTGDTAHNEPTDNNYKYIDVGSGCYWVVSKTIREMLQTHSSRGTYCNLNNSYAGTSYGYIGYLQNSNAQPQPIDPTAYNFYTIGLICYSACLIQNDPRESTAQQRFITPDFVEFLKTGTSADYTDFTLNVTSDFALFNTPPTYKNNIEPTCIYNNDSEFTNNINTLSYNANVKDLLRYFGVLQLDTSKQQTLFGTTLTNVTNDFWTNTYNSIVNLDGWAISGFSDYRFIPLFSPCYYCDDNVDGNFTIPLIGYPQDIHKGFYYPATYYRPAPPTQGMVFTTNYGMWTAVDSYNPGGGQQIQYNVYCNELQLAYSNRWHIPTGQMPDYNFAYWLDMMYKPIVIRMPFVDNNTKWQKRYIILQFVLFNKTTGKPLGTVI